MSVHYLPNFKPDTYLDDLRKARAASLKHLQFLYENQDSCYDKTDVSREFGFCEAIDMCIYLYRRNKGLL